MIIFWMLKRKKSTRWCQHCAWVKRRSHDMLEGTVWPQVSQVCALWVLSNFYKENLIEFWCKNTVWLWRLFKKFLKGFISMIKCVNGTFCLLSSLQAAGDRQQVAAFHEWLQAKQWLLPGVQLLRLLQPLPPGGGFLDPMGTNRQWVGRGAQKEGEAA